MPRGNQEGTIYQRKSDGKWVGAVTLGWKDGKQVRKVMYGKTRAEVAKKLNKTINDQQRGMPMSTTSQTLESFLNRWLEEVVKPNKRTRTYEAYETIVRVHLVPALGSKRLDTLTAQDIQRMLNVKDKDGASGRTRQNIRAIMRAALNQAMRWDLIGRNVATLTDAPDLGDFEAKPLTLKEVTIFLAAADKDRLSAMYTLTAWMGLRQGEVFGIRWTDLDLDQGRMAICKQLQYRHVRTLSPKEIVALSPFDRARVDSALAEPVVDGKREPKMPFLVDLKTDSSRRTLPIPRNVILALKAHRRRQLEDQLLAGSRWRGDTWGLVFCSTIGSPLDQSNVTKQYRAILENAGLERRRFHDLRHSCGSLLAAHKVQPRIIMEILGHSQISTTMNIYTHIELESMREALDSMEGTFTYEAEPRQIG